jgi:hypothetical protein
MEMKQGTLHMRKSTVFLLVTSLNMVLFLLLLLHGRIRQGETALLLQPCCEIARELQLTDLCLFTEARYTRHPAMADLHAAFQDHPLALEHFPSGALVPPPHFRKGGL